MKRNSTIIIGLLLSIVIYSNVAGATPEQISFVISLYNDIISTEPSLSGEAREKDLIRREGLVVELMEYISTQKLQSDDFAHLNISFPQIAAAQKRLAQERSQMQSALVTRERFRGDDLQRQLEKSEKQLAELDEEQQRSLGVLRREIDDLTKHNEAEVAGYKAMITTLKRATEEEKGKYNEAVGAVSRAAENAMAKKRKRLRAEEAGEESEKERLQAQAMVFDAQKVQGANKALLEEQARVITQNKEELDRLQQEMKALELEAQKEREKEAKARKTLEEAMAKKQKIVDGLLDASRKQKGLGRQIKELKAQIEQEQRELEKLRSDLGALDDEAKNKGLENIHAKDYLHEQIRIRERRITDASTSYVDIQDRMSRLQEEIDALRLEARESINTEALVKDLYRLETRYQPEVSRYKALLKKETILHLDEKERSRVREEIQWSRLTESEKQLLLEELDAGMSEDEKAELAKLKVEILTINNELDAARRLLEANYSIVKSLAQQSKKPGQSMYQYWWSGEYSPEKLTEGIQEQLRLYNRALEIHKILKQTGYSVSRARTLSPLIDIITSLSSSKRRLESGQNEQEFKAPGKLERLKLWFYRQGVPEKDLLKIIENVQREIEREEQEERDERLASLD